MYASHPLGLGFWPFFGAKLRVAILLLVVGVTPTGNRETGKFAPDATQLPTDCQPESLAKPARRRSHNPRETSGAGGWRVPRGLRRGGLVPARRALDGGSGRSLFLCKVPVSQLV
jgi:hypothetical protein